jgi:predicted RNase H-like nuclease (RuvC/YqgF family)
LIIAKDEWIIFGDRLREQEYTILSHDEDIRNLKKRLIERDDRFCKLETEYSELKQILLEVKRKQALVMEHDQRTKEAIPRSSTSIPFRTGDGESSAKEA